jgi:tRNA/tmRNA/rRNA uracil-C5-methylase (TrmA/RlmC/RlmD family)
MTIANSNNSINDSHLIQLVLIWNDISSISPRLAALVDMLTSTYSDCLHSIWVNFNRSRTNTILGSEYLHVWGNKEAWTTIGGINIAFSPGSFLQANPEAMAAAIESIGRYIAPNNGGKGIKIVDLYAGVGTLGISVAEKLLSNNSDDNDNGLEESSWIRFVEIVPWAQQPFELSSARLMSKNSRSGSSIKPHPMKMEYHVSSAGSDPQQWLQDATVVICDPPRKGLDKKLLDVLCADNNMNSSSVSQLERVIYLSCGYDALEKDCRKLVDSKQWMIRHVEAFLFFPGTEHIETLVVFDRVT